MWILKMLWLVKILGKESTHSIARYNSFPGEGEDFFLKIKSHSPKLCPIFMTLWAVTHQAPLSMEFPRQEYCHFLLQGIFSIQGSNPGLLHCKQIIFWLRHQVEKGVVSSNFQRWRKGVSVSLCLTAWAGHPSSLALRLEIIPSFLSVLKLPDSGWNTPPSLLGL